MSYNGSGTFLINTAGQPVVSGTVISSTAFNALTADLATGLSTAITKDGQTTVTANIPMANYKFTGLGAGSAAADSANLSQVQSTVVKLLASVSGTDTITAVGSPTVAAYAAGQMFYFVAAGDNTGAVTINIDSLGAKAVTRDGSVALAAGDIKSGEVVVIVYDGTRFQVVSQLNSSGDARFANVSIASALNVGGVATVTGGSVLNGGVVINEPGADVDFRVESDTDANAFFLDGTNGNIGIGTGSPANPLQIVSNTTSQLNIQAASGNTNAQINLEPAGTGIALIGPANNVALAFRTNATERLRISADGNLGLGVTPSAWDVPAGKAMDIGTVGNSIWGVGASNMVVGSNIYYASSSFKYANTGSAASAYQQVSAEHRWFSAGSGTAGNNITFTQAMTLDASGNLGVGTASPEVRLHVVGSNGDIFRIAGANENFYVNCGSQGSYVGNGASAGGETIYFNAVSDYMAFFTASTERARITSAGAWCVNKTSANSGSFDIKQYTGTSISRWESVDAGTITALQFVKTSGGAAEVGSITMSTTATAYVTSSDRRLKENIVPAPDAGSKIDAIQIVSHDWKGEADAHVEFGVVAQDLHAVAPQAVTVGDDGEEVEKTWGVDYSKLVPMLVKEIQSLRARVAALEGA